jgi:Carboxypeptidase regulatory-like domain
MHLLRCLSGPRTISLLAGRGARLHRIAPALLVLLLLAPGARSQTTAGSISGTVVDPQGAAVPNASVSAENETQNSTERVITDRNGHFVFPVLLPGSYTITVDATGFTPTRQIGIVLNANSVLTLDLLKLQLGSTTQTVQVKAQGQDLDVDTAQRSESVLGKQIENIQVNGQSPLFFLTLIPGVYNQASYVESTQQFGNTYVNGSRASQLHVTVNGGTNEDTGGNSGWMAPVSLDAVQEVKVLTNSYEAEYGRSSGAQISMVTKSGTSQFHGTGFEYYRDKSMNANTWTNNRVGLPLADYHYNDAGFNLGGPIYIPAKFNTDRSKLFFFVDEEWQHQLVPSGQQQVTVPTAAERTGDFSQSVDQNGNPVVIKDPTTGQPFPGNRIPAGRLYAPTVALLNLLPLPNAANSSHPSYNYISQVSTQHPRREDNLRVDYNLNSKWHFYGSLLKATDNEATPYGIWGTTNIPLYTLQYSIPGYHYVLNATTVLSPTAVNEVTFVQGHDSQYNGTRPGSGDWTPKSTGVTLNTLYPAYQPSDLIPGFKFGGTKIGNSASFNTSSFPFYNANTNIEVFDNFSKTLRSHFLKAGVYFDHNWKVQPSGATYDGAYDYGDNPSNPLDSGFGFSNAALGVFNSFQQSSNYSNAYPLYKQWEFYAQDTWKVSSRLTLSYGVRFYMILPIHNTEGTLSNFLPDTWTPSQAPTLLQPAFVGGQRVAVDPATGQTYPAVDIGSYLAGSGNALNGIKVLGGNYITKNPGISPAPRIGLAYDLSGSGDVILHVGGGAFYDRTQTDPYDSLIGNPPTTVQPIVNYGYVASLNPSSSLFIPPSLSTFSTSSAVPVTFNYNVGIQNRLPFSMVSDIAYVGAISNHQLQQLNVNAVPFGADFLPQNQDPTLQLTNPNAPAGSNALLPQFVTPYTGYGAIVQYQLSGNSNYNALQATLKRRFTSGLFLSVSYTWSKCMDTTDGVSQIRFDQYTHEALYGPCGTNVNQNAIVNYVYPVPKLAGLLGKFNNGFSRTVLNDWQISGVSTFQSGPPYSVALNVSGVSAQNIIGTPDWTPVPLCIADPRSGTSNSPYNRINAAAFAVPAVGSNGLGCKRNNLYGPGTDDWDMSLQKTIAMTERWRLELRGEAFNIFNHTQFSGVNSTINYSGLNNPVVTNLPYSSTGGLNIGGFGTVAGVLPARVIQLVAKVRF